MAAVARWPGHIEAGSVSDALVGTMDMLPTFAALAGAPLPRGREFDGMDITPVLAGNATAGHATERGAGGTTGFPSTE